MNVKEKLAEMRLRRGGATKGQLIEATRAQAMIDKIPNDEICNLRTALETFVKDIGESELNVAQQKESIYSVYSTILDIMFAGVAKEKVDKILVRFKDIRGTAAKAAGLITKPDGWMIPADLVESQEEIKGYIPEGEEYYNGDCDFFHSCIDGEDVGGEGGCYGCVHNLEEDER